MSKQSSSEKIKKLQQQIDELQKEIASEKDPAFNEKAPKARKIFFKWSAPSRVFVRRDRAWFVKVSFIAILLIFLMVIINDRELIIAISAVLLVAFLLATVPPNHVHHEVTSLGIKTTDVFYKWKDLKEFWVAEKYGMQLLYIDTKLRFPGLLTILFGKEEDPKSIVLKISEYLEYKDLDPKKQGWLSRVTEGQYLSPGEFGLIEDFTKSSKDGKDEK